jgi:hypothetical protein
MLLDDVRKELKRAEKDLLSRKNVVSVGVGYKTSNGKKTKKLSLICSVEQKKPKEALANDDIIPREINGVATDVVQSGVIKAFSNTEKRRPALGGDSIGHFAITAGTLGCLVKKNGETLILSNNHVLANSNEAVVNDAILQPGSYDRGTMEDKIATLKEWVSINFVENGLPDTECPIAKSSAFIVNLFAFLTGSKSRVQAYSLETATNLMDAALAKPINDADVKNEINGIGVISGTKEVTLGMKVHKQGRTTGYTTGVVDQIDVTTQVSYGTNKTGVFSDQIIITTDESVPFSQPGDSGSAVLSGTDLVGLLFAGSDTVTIINRISNVFGAFGCTIV